MILHYVADGAGLIVKGASALDSELFSHGDFNIVYVSATPEWLQEQRRKTGVKHVVDRPLAKVVMNAKNCMLLESAKQYRIQRPCRGEVCPKRLFDNDPSTIGTVRF